jgi:hypothetical protein
VPPALHDDLDRQPEIMKASAGVGHDGDPDEDAQPADVSKAVDLVLATVGSPAGTCGVVIAAASPRRTE